MIAQSFRVRLALWIIGVLAAILLAVGGVLAYGVQNGMEAAVDRELRLRVQRFARGDLPGPIPGPRPPGDGFGGEPGPLPDDRRPFEFQPQPEAPRDGGPLPAPASAKETGAQGAWPSDAEAERAAEYARPRWINREGVVQGPPGAHEAWDMAAVPPALSGEWRYSTVSLDGERVRVLTVPWRFGPEIGGALQVARPLGELDRLRDSQLQMLLWLAPLALAVAGVGALFLTERALRPVRQVTQAAAQLGADDLSRRLPVAGKDELAQLASTFNGMLGRLEAAFEQQRRFTADASHELRTPLARIKLTTSEALSGEQSTEEYQTALRLADQAADGMTRLVEELLLLARIDSGNMRVAGEPLDLRDVVRDAMMQLPETGGVQVLTELSPRPVAIHGDARHLRRVLLNLLQNALRHTPPGGRIVIGAAQSGDEATLTVADTGEGIAPEHLPHLGERFYRVDASRTRSRRAGAGAGGGSGLGLAICRSLVDLHGGRLTFASQPRHGTIVTVRFPSAPQTTLPAGMPEALPAPVSAP